MSDEHTIFRMQSALMKKKHILVAVNTGTLARWMLWLKLATRAADAPWLLFFPEESSPEPEWMRKRKLSCLLGKISDQWERKLIACGTTLDPKGLLPCEHKWTKFQLQQLYQFCPELGQSTQVTGRNTLGIHRNQNPWPRPKAKKTKIQWPRNHFANC